MQFVFTPSPHFVNPGHEASSDLHVDSETATDVAKLRDLYPELGSWGDLALYVAWGSFSQQVNMISWEPITEREEDFLHFCCWEQTRGEFPWGNDRRELAQANKWKF
ncbi:hypothetical protein ACFQDN_21650 [Pseudomonas asuensis]|uniref:Uncharacterized protein n=1 Tax=Pseudomonas asuensis TaxID=1825787 RepID=A0ABQ2H1G2_9PSED|nr:hypothetical protein [Pseudomonas asuensis]GGM26399.1 hypothetical protein GCM10009425_41310 [Pseudomonas asuensis]